MTCYALTISKDRYTYKNIENRVNEKTGASSKDRCTYISIENKANKKINAILHVKTANTLGFQSLDSISFKYALLNNLKIYVY